MKLLLICISISAISAQEALNHSSASGVVTDPAGAVIEGAAIVARQLDTNRKSAAATDHEGRFRFPYLAIGTYEFTVTKARFAPAKRTLTLTVGSAFDLPFSLAIASEASSITVNAEAALLEAARTQIAGTIAPSEVRNLPLNGRNFLDLALVVPGVSPTNTRGLRMIR